MTQFDLAIHRSSTDAYPAPLRPLGVIQCVGYLDGVSAELRCVEGGLDGFTKDRWYRLQTSTVRSLELDSKTTLDGAEEFVELIGVEMAVVLVNDCGRSVVFSGESNKLEKADYSFEDLVGHFHIPVVPDIVEQNRDAYHGHLDRISEIEQSINRRPFP